MISLIIPGRSKMEFNHLYLLSTYLKKWSFGDSRISLNYSFCMNGTYVRNYVDMRMSAPLNMVNEFMNHCFYRAKEQVSGETGDTEGMQQAGQNIVLVNESEIKLKLSAFITKIQKEFNTNKRSNGRQRMISTRSLDFFYNDFEFEPLDDEIKFFVHLNRGANKMNGDLWSNAVDDLTNALAIKKDDIVANKYMATSLKKLGRFGEALNYLKVYAETENSTESLEDLAEAYLSLYNFKAADKAFAKLEKNEPGSLPAMFGRAMIAYKQGKGYKTLLDKIYKLDPDWLVEKIKKDWDYKLPEYIGNESNRWNAAAAARYLGFERPFDLTRKAFNGEMPSYFDADKGTIRFIKAELDAWTEIMNRYKIDEVNYHTYPDRLTKDEVKQGRAPKKRAAKKPAKEKAETAG